MLYPILCFIFSSYRSYFPPLLSQIDLKCDNCSCQGPLGTRLYPLRHGLGHGQVELHNGHCPDRLDPSSQGNQGSHPHSYGRSSPVGEIDHVACRRERTFLHPLLRLHFRRPPPRHSPLGCLDDKLHRYGAIADLGPAYRRHAQVPSHYRKTCPGGAAERDSVFDVDRPEELGVDDGSPASLL